MKEAESDTRDRLKEKEEIEELKNKIFSGEFDDPNAEFERVMNLDMNLFPRMHQNETKYIYANYFFRLRKNAKSNINLSY